MAAVLVVLLLLPAGESFAMVAETGAPPSVMSDKEDYAPGELVTLTGWGWVPGEPVHMTVRDDAGGTWTRSVDVVADADGRLSDRFALPDWYVPAYSVTATGPLSGTATSAFTDAFEFKQLRLASADGPERYLFTPGDAIHPAGVTLHRPAYKFLVLDPAGNVVSPGRCTPAEELSSTDNSYTVKDADPASTGSAWTFRLQVFTTTSCDVFVTSISKQFYVAKATAHADTGLTDVRTSFAPGARAYMRVLGLRPGWVDWNVAWVLPSGATACANTAGSDRPDATSSGVLPISGGFLQYRPSTTNTGEGRNWESNYEVRPCPELAADNEGQWRLRLQLSDAPAFSVDLAAFTVDATPPAVSVPDLAAGSDSGISASDDTTRDGAPAFNGTSEPRARVSLRRGPVVIGTATAGADGQWTIPDPSAPEGRHLYTASATDAAGNSATSAPLPVLVDSTAPAVVRRAADDGCDVPGDAGWCRGVQTAAFTASDGGAGFADGAGGSVAARDFSRSSAVEGSAVLIASGPVVDVAGNADPGIDAGPYKIDSTAPTSAATSPVYANALTIPVAYTASDPGVGSSGVTRVDLLATPPGGASPGKASTDEPAGSGGSFPYTAVGGDGRYGFFTGAVDVAGNVEAAPPAPDTTTLLDTRAPSAAIGFPAVDGWYTVSSWDAGCGTAGGDACGSATDGPGVTSGVAAVSVSIRRASDLSYWNGTSFSSTSEVWLPATGTAVWSYSLPGVDWPADGTYAIRSSASDAAGNVARGVARSLRVNAAPRVSAGGPYAGGESAIVALKGTVSSDVNAVSWSYAKGTDVDAGTTCALSGASTAAASFKCTDDGTFSLTLTATDGINPPVSKVAVVSMSNAAPAVAITSPSSGATTVVGGLLLLAASFSDRGTNDRHTSLIDWGDGTTSTPTLVESAGSGKLSGVHRYAKAGTYRASVLVRDDDGGAGTSPGITINVK